MTTKLTTYEIAVISDGSRVYDCLLTWGRGTEHRGGRQFSCVSESDARAFADKLEDAIKEHVID